METAILATTILIVIINVILITIILNKRDDKTLPEVARLLSDSEAHTREAIFRLDKGISSEMSEFGEKLGAKTGAAIERLNQTTENRLLAIERKVSERLEQGFKETNDAFARMSASLARIDEAQKHIDSLNKEVVSLQEILGDKKLRGVYGEMQLSALLYSVFGEAGGVYELQYGFGGLKVDALLKLPEPLGNISVDSKFPLENYKRMTDKLATAEEAEAARKLFKADVRKHIGDISDKYIIPGETSPHAIMFIPAEAIFANIHAYHTDLLEFAAKKNIWLVSPTTFMALLTTVQVVLRNVERSKYAMELHDALEKLSQQFDLYRRRWQKLSNTMETVYKEVREVNITTEKISERFDAISHADAAKLGEGNL